MLNIYKYFNIMRERSDIDLLRAYTAGETMAFDVLYSRYQQRLYNYVFSMVKESDLTADIVQETFILWSLFINF